ncbi:SPFH domain-containing protein [Streptomyces cocklensis]|uniref:Regulator of protease activity HflC, stomatin/prohibitin superfamily n=1 Tax=Actinacidiphila cocklensis TaxID=887465 RepID=A0A9W4GV47_9ACTN|nr:SPFH domain-containing protein [Actinacidiphila cocklensis]MDD1059497.1 SPFH domain-containing protein [Actinacidiphila cocklensis]CAG6397945.1 Regulator of protease activity HflC, stomatin/prohibitin superfamily [Actinacidiphila cocklensis]
MTSPDTAPPAEPGPYEPAPRPGQPEPADGQGPYDRTARLDRVEPSVEPGAYGQAEVPGQAGPAAEQTLLMPRVVPPADPLAERAGPCLPGWTAGTALLAAVAAAGWLLWRAGLLPLPPAGGLLPDPPRDAARGSGLWSGLVVIGAVAALAACGLARGRPGSVWVLTRHGGYRGTVRRTGLLWISPLLRRRRMDVSLRHWRSRPIDAVDAHGTPVQVTVLLVWRIRETARAAFAVDDCTRLLREEVEAAVARAVSRHPADDFGGERGDAVTLRDCDRLRDELGRLVAAAVREAGVEVFSVTPVRLEYAPEVAAVMRRARIATLEARQRRAVLDDVLGAVADTLRGITDRGLVELDDHERKSLVRDLTVALLATPAPAGSRPRG